MITKNVKKQNQLIRVASVISDKIIKLNEKIENVNGKWMEVLVLFLYSVLHLVMAVFHEPWYDEAVAWQIAKCASIKKIIFEIPHYEGHPPLWHLILSCFAKLGAPYELSLTIISLLFTFCAIWLLLFKSPFPRLMKLLIPFTFFFFYQYGVISRPYCMMMVAILLLACFYKKRNEHPLKYVLSMLFLCLTSAYGIIIAGSIAFLWVCEICSAVKKSFKHKNVKFSFRQYIAALFLDKRSWLLMGLLIFAFFLGIGILPRKDTYGIKINSLDTNENSIFLRLLYTLCLMPADAIYTNTYSRDVYLKYYSFDTAFVLTSLIVSCIFFTFVYIWGKTRKTLWLYILPHIAFGVFFAFVYGTIHHTGIELFLIIFWLWITMDAKDTINEDLLSNKRFAGKNQQLVQVGSVFLISFCVVMSLYWNICACSMEIKKDYSIGRNEAKFIKDNNLDQYNIMVSWTVVTRDGERIFIDINSQVLADNILPYFDRNIFYNVGKGQDEFAYSSHRVASEDENESNRKQWASEGAPDILIGIPDLKWVFGDSVKVTDYVAVWYRYKYKPWKDDRTVEHSMILIRKDLYEKLDLEEVEMIDTVLGVDEYTDNEN